MAANQHLQKLRADINKKLHEPNSVTNVLEKIESKTGLDRFYLVAGVAGALSLYLIFGHFAEIVCNVVGFLYPAYISIKAIESTTKNDDTQWLTYWVVFALFNVFEFASDIIVGWFPIYWLCKCIFMLYLYLPMTMGAQKLYTRFIRPFVQKHQQSIDSKLGQVYGKVADTARDAAHEATQSAQDTYEQYKQN
jgi:receptor expression-enhancing protein 5/6